MGRKKTIDMVCGEQIARHRKAAGLSQERLGEIVGLHQTHISMLERGMAGANLDSLVRIADALDVSPDLLGASDVRIADTPEEVALVSQYRAATPDGKRRIEKLAEEVSGTTRQQPEEERMLEQLFLATMGSVRAIRKRLEKLEKEPRQRAADRREEPEH